MSSKYFYSFILSFVSGIVLGFTISMGYALVGLFLITAFTLLVVRIRDAGHSRRFFVSCLLIGCALGVFRVELNQQEALRNSKSLDQFVGTSVSVSGVVSEEPDVRDGYTNVILDLKTISQGHERMTDTAADVALKDTVRVLVRASVYPILRYGDAVVVTGKIVIPQNFESKDGGRVFNYSAYLAKENIFYQILYPQIVVKEHGQGNVVREKLFLLKEFFLRNIMRSISEPEASLAGGILLGAKQSLGEELLQKFRDTGVAHIVVLSGYNIAVVGSVIARAVMVLPLAMRFLVSAFGIIMFATMVGGGATVVRATIMGLIVILARTTGRESVALRALCFAGMLMLLHNPSLLLFDISFQLSFVATLALIVLVPILEKTFFGISSTLRPSLMREIFLATLATQIFVLPLLLYHMGSASIVGLLVNVVVLPVVPFAMLVSALVSVFASVPFVGVLLGHVAYAMLTYIIFIVEFFSKIPYGSLHVKIFPLSFLLAAYFLLAWWVIKSRTQGILQRKSLHEF